MHFPPTRVSEWVVFSGGLHFNEAVLYHLQPPPAPAQKLPITTGITALWNLRFVSLPYSCGKATKSISLLLLLIREFVHQAGFILTYPTLHVYCFECCI